jgi:hypothetical protein
VPADQVTGTSGFLLSLPVDRRWHVRPCAFHKEMLDRQLYAAGAKFLAGSNATTYGIMPGSGLHLELTLLHRIGLSPREALAAATSTMPMCSAGAMSDASNPAVSQTFYSSTPIRERTSQPSTKSIRSCLRVQLWTATLCWQWAERISRDSNRGPQMKVSYCLSSLPVQILLRRELHTDQPVLGLGWAATWSQFGRRSLTSSK